MEVFNYFYSIPYLALLLVFTAMMFIEFKLLKSDKDIKLVRWTVIIVFIIFFGLRGFVYTDWAIYYPMFEDMPTIWDGGFTALNNSDFSERFLTDAAVGKAGLEVGFLYFTFFFKSLIPDYFAFIFFNTVIDVILLNIFFKRYSRYYALSFVLFIVFGGIGIEFNLLRNIKSILLFLISLKYLEEQKIVPYMLLNLFGFLFHSSALIFLPLYFILNRNWPVWFKWGLFIIGNVLFLFQIKYLEPLAIGIAEIIGGRLGVQIRLYFVSDFYSQPYGLGLGYIERVITFLVMILLEKKLIAQNNHNKIFINSFIIYFIVYFFFAELLVAVERLSLLFVFSYWILYGEVLGIVKESINKLVVYLVVFFYSILKLGQANSNVFSKYDNIITGIESFEDRSTRIYNDLDVVLGPQQN